MTSTPSPLPPSLLSALPIPIPSTPLITSSLAYARAHLTDLAYNHIVRSFLFGVLIASRIPALQSIDTEVHAVAAILHDLGWDITNTLVSTDKRFEVDGAEAARAFLTTETKTKTKNQGSDDDDDDGAGWDHRKLQLVWDAIALHTTPNIALYKEPEVVATITGIRADFSGPTDPRIKELLSWEEYEAVVEAFPRLGFRDGVKEILCGFCRSKPETTVETIMQGFGERFVEGYREGIEGLREVDFILNGTLD
ncbi:MAG: hypothetical protein M1836_001313 [Candelina mexicana]|nr:MAG: hypothetical protein M1836_001313 [Candelina mexicana]